MKARIAHVVVTVVALLTAFAADAAAREVRVVFLNPGTYQRDVGWTLRSLFMQAAAEQFGIQLEVLYSGRDRLRIVEQARALASRAVPPDYVVVVNESEEGLQLLEAFRDRTIRVVVMHNDLTEEQRRRIGNERGPIMPNWIGSIITDERAGGYALMAELARRVNGPLKVLGLGGAEVTPVSAEREEGMRAFMAENGNGEVVQVVPGNWTREDSREKAQWLLARYPDANVFWAANDSMALGVHDAVVQAGRQDRMVVGGIGGFVPALEAVERGELAATVGGNGLIGAWVMVMIHDYEHGRDFAELGRLRLEARTVAVAGDAKSAARLRRLADNPGRIDFRRFSRAENKALKTYDFSYGATLAASR